MPASPSFSDWTGRPPTSTEAKLIEAALTHGVVSATSCRLSVLIAEAGLPKGSAYRAASDMAAVLELLHQDTCRTIFQVAGRALADLRDRDQGAGFVDVVKAGIEGVLAGLDEARWTGNVLGRDRDAATSYLLRRDEGTIYSRLVGFASWCAVNKGADPAKARPAAETLVWQVLTAAVGALSPVPGSKPDWPAKVDGLDSKVSTFAQVLGLQDKPAPAFFPGDLFADEPGSRVTLAAGAPI